MTHTPGPWQVSGGRSRIDAYGHTVGPDGFGIACVFYSDQTTAEHIASLADARLIAAAPDLLKALNALERQVLQNNIRGDEWMDEALELTRAAIAKAEGRS